MTFFQIMRTDDGLALKFDYDPEAIGIIKAAAPYPYRKWWPDERVWTVENYYAKEVWQAIVARYGRNSISVTDMRGKDPSSASSSSGSRRQNSQSPPPRDDEQKKQKSRPNTNTRITGPKWVTTLFDRAPAELHAKLFKQLAIAIHPDTGGDTEMMQELNDTYRKFYKK